MNLHSVTNVFDHLFIYLDIPKKICFVSFLFQFLKIL